MMEPFTVTKDRDRIVPYLAGTLAFVWIGVWIVTTEDATGDSDAWKGWLCIIVFGLVALVYLKQLVAGGVVLSLDQQGFRAPAFGNVDIPWSAVAAVTLQKERSVDVLHIELKHPAVWLARRSALQRSLAKIDTALGYPAYSINLAFADQKPEEVLRRFQLGIKGASGKARRQGD